MVTPVVLLYHVVFVLIAMAWITIACPSMQPYHSSDSTTHVDVWQPVIAVAEVFEQVSKRAQISMGIGNCWVIDGYHGAGVTDQSLFQLMSSGKFTIDAAITRLIDDGYIDPTWTLRQALQTVIPNFGLDGAGDITVAQFMQFQAPLGVLGIHVPIQYTQWDKTPDLSLLIKGLQTMRPTFIPKTNASDWYPEPTVGGNFTTHQYDPVVMGWIAQALVEAWNPFRLPYVDYMNLLGGIIEQAITRPNNGLINRVPDRYELYFKFPQLRPDLWARYIPPTAFPVTRNLTAAEILYNEREQNPLSVEFKTQVIDYPYIALLQAPFELPAGSLPDQFSAINITTPLLADPSQGDFNNAAFAGRSNAITLGAWAMTMANLGKVPGTSRPFRSPGISIQAGQRVWTGTDLVNYGEGTISYARYGGNKPTPGAISSCLPEDTIIHVGSTESFLMFIPSMTLSLAVTTADYPSPREQPNVKMGNAGLSIVDIACRTVKALQQQQQQQH